MLNRIRFALMTMRNQWRLLNTPPQPMFDGFRTPVLTREERLEARRRKAAEVAHAKPGFHVGRLT
jgi:hypothetical protein